MAKTKTTTTPKTMDAVLATGTYEQTVDKMQGGNYKHESNGNSMADMSPIGGKFTTVKPKS